MLRSRPLFTTLTLAVAAVGLGAGAAQAAPVYDARTMGMGGNSVGLAEDARTTFWNPAAAGFGRSFGLYLPTLSLGLTNNILGIAEVNQLTTAFSALGGGTAGDTTALNGLLTRLGSGGLVLASDFMAEPLGVAVPVGPGTLTVRPFAMASLGARASLSQDFAKDLNSLVFGGGFNNILASVNTLSSTIASGNPNDLASAEQEVAKLEGLLQTNLSAFIKPSGTGYTKKSLDLTTVSAAAGGVAIGYGARVPLPPAVTRVLPQAQLSLGATAKVMVPATALASGALPTVPLPGGAANATISPVGGGAGAAVSLDIDKEVSELAKAIVDFRGGANLATTSALAAKTGAFLSDGLSKSTMRFTSTTPDPFGLGMDLGASLRVNEAVSVGLTLVNPLLFWNATRTTYTYDLSGSSIRLVSSGPEKVGFREVMPVTLRAGAAWQPVFGDRVPAAFRSGLTLQGALEAPFGGFYGPTAHLGVEKAFGPAALRLGAIVLGPNPMITAGLGIQTKPFQLNLGAGVDPGLRSAQTALSLGVGF